MRALPGFARVRAVGEPAGGRLGRGWTILLLAVALLIAACGGDDDSPVVGEEQGSVVTTEAGTAASAEDEAAADETPAVTAGATESGATETVDEKEGPAEGGPVDGGPVEAADDEDGAAADESAGDEDPPVDSGDATEEDAELEDAEPEDVEAEAEDEGPDPRLAFLIELTDADDVAVVERIGATVAERRGLALLDPVPVYLLRRDDVPAYFDADDETSGADEPGDRFDDRVLQMLDIIGPEVSLGDLFRDLFVGLALGFYDFDLQGFVIISSNDHVAGGDVSTITHEFVHVLQDQHFAIADYFDAHEDNSDRILAARFVVEGDARNSEALFRDLESELGGQLEPRRDRTPGLNGSVPPLLQAIFNAPYFTGVAAIAEVLGRQGQAGVDALLGDLPPSTEQLLHRDKLEAREAPILVEAPDASEALGEDWTALGSDTIGEFMLRTMLSPVTGGGVASGAAAGWGGDRLTVYRGPDDQSVLVWELRWDSPEDVTEAVTGFRSWLPARTGAALQDLGPGTEWRSSGDRGSAWLRRFGESVFVVIGDDAAAVERVGLSLP